MYIGILLGAHLILHINRIRVKRYWLFWGVTQCKLVVNVTAFETGYIICIAAEALNRKVIFTSFENNGRCTVVFVKS
jgi:hypothetical protein